MRRFPRRWKLLRRHECSAPRFGVYVVERLGEGPLMACQVCDRVLSLAVLEVGRLHENAPPVLTCVLAVGVHIVHADRHRVCHLAWSRRPTVVTHVSDDDGAVAKTQLRAMAFPDP